MYFTGTQGQNIETTVKGILQSRFMERLSADPYLTALAPYGGGNVVTNDQDASAAVKIGQPFIILTLYRCSAHRWGTNVNGTYTPGTRYSFVILAEVVANDFSGAVIGVANPVGSNEILSNALVSIIEDDYAYFRDAGLEGIHIRSETEVVQQLNHINPHHIGFMAFSLNDLTPLSSESSSSA